MDKSDLTIIVGAIVTVSTGIGTLAWRIFTAWIADRAQARAAELAQAKELASAMLGLSMRLESVEKALDRVEVRVERVSGVQDVPHEAIEKAQRTSTPARGVGQYRLGRARTEPGG